MILQRVVLILFMVLGQGAGFVKGQSGKRVWTHASADTGRFQCAVFRQEFEVVLLDQCSGAWINLFADSRYQLWINGVFAGFGPVRHYPPHPQYDPYDLKPYLREGQNQLEVKVYSNGTPTFQLRKMPPVFWASGEVVSPASHTDLSTPGKWQCRTLTGYDPHAVRMNFALGPMEVFDGLLDGQSAGWSAPVEVAYADAWGPFTSRAIPMLIHRIRQPIRLAGAHLLIDSMQTWTFREKAPDQSRLAFGTSLPGMAFTYIYSPKKQSVWVRNWWGEYFLNGKGPLAGTPATEGRQRQDMRFDLQRGWSALWVRGGSFWGTWDFYLSAPRSAQLHLSPEKKFSDTTAFLAFLAPEEHRQAIRDSKPMIAPEALPPRWNSNWQPHRHARFGVNPAWDLAWAEPGAKLPYRQDHLQDISLTGDASLVFDFRYKTLGQVMVEWEAPPGTVLDL